MATTKKNTPKTKADRSQEPVADTISRRKQVKLGTGIALLLVGTFICFSIISYCFTWQVDQDKVLSGEGWMALLKSRQTVANWGGRIGAVISHIMVYEWAGIASLAIGLWIAAIGLGMLYGKRIIPVTRYLRWLSLLILVVAPVLTYVMPDAAFSFGGAWGNEAISYMNGFFGHIGTGLILFAIVCFFLFVVFALDISPVLRRARKTAQKMADVASTMATAQKEKIEAARAERQNNSEEENNTFTTENTNYGNDNIKPLAAIDDEDEPEEEWDMQLVDKSTHTPTINDMYAAKQEEPEPAVEEEQLEEPIELAPEPAPKPAPKPKPEEEFSFEVTKHEDERVIPTHGGHISIADNEKYAPELDLPDYKFPTLDLLEERSSETIILDKDELEQNKNQIINTLKSFGIEIQRISATVGPTVTLYEIVPAEGVRISKIRNLEDDIALNLAALGIRIIAPIPGRGTIGIEVPNANKQTVSIRQLLSSEKFVNSKMSLPIALGKKIDNENYIVDLATMPHLLMAGATGQGKSVGINTILVSLLYKKHPSQLKFVMVDPKKVELSIYRTIEKHFLAKLPNEEEAIITDTKKVIYTLNALCIEMDNRYELLKDGGARNIKEYNEKFIRRRLNPEHGHKYLPFIVLVIDEFADLMMTAGKEVEIPIARLAQLARAVGIHLIIATQRPSVNVITGTIKANFPARIAFKVSAKVDSRTILDAGGAEQLIGRGDMLISFGSELLRLQCAFVDTPEVDNVTEFIGDQRGYLTAFELPEYEGEENEKEKNVDLTNRDKLFEECARTVVQTQSGSTSMLQRRFNLGYNRAGRIMDQLEAADIVGPAVGSKPRDVKVHTEADLEELLNSI
ncbi:MAG: DNA translocase FtsK 4TM domain-containing protein [Chitinophagaceae bacterium]|nr:DNA translocase FtsK 4TM domain-containing protein [Chitinophagaceae bacterium]